MSECDNAHEAPTPPETPPEGALGAATPLRRSFALAVWALLAAAGALGYAVYLRWMWFGWFPAWDQTQLGLWDRLTEGESYYTHGPLVPLISLGLFILLVARTRIPVRPRPWWGLAVLLASQGMYLLVSFEKIRFVLGVFALGAMVGLTLMLWGLAALKRLWFAIFFLGFAMPMGDTLFAGVSYTLRMLATDMAVGLAGLIGVLVERMDNVILLAGGKSMVVGDVCSGLRTLISLLAFGVIYVYVCRLHGWLRWLLLAAIVPVGLICNSLRIAAIILVANYGSVEFAAGEFHDSSGFVVFVLAFLIMFALEKFILWAAKAAGRPVEVRPLLGEARLAEGEACDAPALLLATASWRGVLAVAVMAVTAIAGWQLAHRPMRPWDNAVVNAATPDAVVINGESYQGRTMQLEDRILRILNTRDYFYRQYSAPGRSPVSIMVVYSQDNRVSTHAPEVCITAAGGRIINKRTLDVEVPGLGAVACRVLMVEEGDYYTCYLYTLRAGGSYTPSIWKQQALISVNGILGRDASGALIRISVPSRDNDFQANMDVLTQAMAASLPPLDAVMDRPRNLPEAVE